jgi:hypothetical protein
VRGAPRQPWAARGDARLEVLAAGFGLLLAADDTATVQPTVVAEAAAP